MSENTLQEVNFEGMMQTFKQVVEFNSSNPIEALSDILNNVNKKTAPAVLSFINSLLSNDIYIKEELQPEFTGLVHQIIKALEDNLSQSLQAHISDKAIIFSNKQASTESKPIDIINEFKNIIFETLIKKSKYEIWNSINILFNRDNPVQMVLKNSSILSLLKYMGIVPAQQAIPILREIAYLLVDDDIRPLLSHFEEKTESFDILLLILKFSNRDMLEKISTIIYTEKKYFKEPLISALPEIDINRILPNIKDYNWEIIACLIENRPELTPNVIQAFKENVLGMQKRFFIEKILEKDYLFSLYIEELDLATEELLDLCVKSKHFTNAYYSRLSNEEQTLEFCKTLIKKDEAFIIELVKKNEGHHLFEIFLKCLTKTMRFIGELKEFIIQRFSRQESYFHNLMSYLDMNDIEELLTKYYIKNVSIEFLLRKMHPQELLIEIHKFKDASLGIKLLGDCFNSDRFDSKDWMLAMKSLENSNSPIKMRTCYWVLRKKPNLRNQAILFLKRSINDYIWDSQISSVGIIKCMELLQDDCITVFDAMNQEEVVYVLKKSPDIQATVRRFLSEYKEELTPKLRFLQGCLHHLQ